MKLAALLIFAAALCACASKGFHRQELLSHVGVERPVFTDAQIKEAFDAKPNLPKPFKMAVYFKKAKGEWRWSDEDRKLFNGIVADLKSRGLVSEVIPLVDSLVEQEDLRGLRLAAAKHQADALLIVGGAGEIDRYINKWGWTYALLAPAFFVPGSHADTLFVTEATLWDVRNEFLYLTAQAEATSESRHVAAFGRSDRELLNAAKHTALADLKKELTDLIAENGKKL